MTLVGPYRVAERLGEGGMGEVRRAVDTMLEREVALKTLRPEMARRDDLVERFRVEAIALARLHHRHIAAVYAFFHDAGQYHIAMQFVRGHTLEAVLQQRGRLPWREAAAIAADVLQALDHAHALGVVHRDLKPANLMVDTEGRTVVMDFGIARVLARGRQTRAGTLVGTLEYLAPEVVRGDPGDARSDLYSLGCVLYEMVTGGLPFAAMSDYELMRAHAEQAPPRPGVRAGDLPAALEAIMLRALEKQPQRRFASAREFLEALALATGAAVPVTASPRRGFGDRLAGAMAGACAALSQAKAWLALPTLRDGVAWRRWLSANFGLAGASVVAVAALGVGVSLTLPQRCCNPPPVVLTEPLPVKPLAAIAEVTAPLVVTAAPVPEAEARPGVRSWNLPMPAPSPTHDAAVPKPADPPPEGARRRPPPAAQRGETSPPPPAPSRGWYVHR
jgi:serine/threonine-protein kinase